MKSDITKRKLEQYFFLPGDVAATFCKRHGIPQTEFGKWEYRTPGAIWLRRLSEKFNKPMEWFVTEEAEVPSEYTLVPMYEAKLSAGGGSFILTEAVAGTYAFRTAWLKRVNAHKDALKLFSIRGDSMIPLLQDGDVALIDTRRTVITRKGIFAIRRDDQVSIKRLAKNGSKIHIISENANLFPIEDVEGEAIEIIGQMIWSARTWI